MKPEEIRDWASDVRMERDGGETADLLDSLAVALAERDAEIARLRRWLGEAIAELDIYYSEEYAGDHPYSVRKLANARACWDDARAALTAALAATAPPAETEKS